MQIKSSTNLIIFSCSILKKDCKLNNFKAWRWKLFSNIPLLKDRVFHYGF